MQFTEGDRVKFIGTVTKGTVCDDAHHNIEEGRYLVRFDDGSSEFCDEENLILDLKADWEIEKMYDAYIEIAYEEYVNLSDGLSSCLSIEEFVDRKCMSLEEWKLEHIDELFED